MTILVFVVGVLVGAGVVVVLVDRRMRRPHVRPLPDGVTSTMSAPQTVHGGGYWAVSCTSCCWWNLWSTTTCVLVWVPGGGGGSGTQH